MERMWSETFIFLKEESKNGWGGRIRTYECRLQKPVPYRKAHEEWWVCLGLFFENF